MPPALPLNQQIKLAAAELYRAEGISESEGKERWIGYFADRITFPSSCACGIEREQDHIVFQVAASPTVNVHTYDLDGNAKNKHLLILPASFGYAMHCSLPLNMREKIPREMNKTKRRKKKITEEKMLRFSFLFFLILFCSALSTNIDSSRERERERGKSTGACGLRLYI